MQLPAPEPPAQESAAARPEDPKAARLLQSFQDAIRLNDPDAIDRCIAEIARMGAPCISGLKSALLRETDARTGKNIAYALLRVSTPDAFAALLQSAASVENKQTKTAILDILQNGLNKENSGWLVQFALGTDGTLRSSAAAVIAGTDNPDLLAAVVNGATTPEQRLAAADVLQHTGSPQCAKVLQECAMTQDPTLAKAAINALSGQAGEDSTRLLLNSFSAYGPAPDSGRFDLVVDALRTMLRQNPDTPGLAITIESLMTTSENSTTRAAAAAALPDNPSTDRDTMIRTYQKALDFESDPQVRACLLQGLKKIQEKK